MAPSVASPESHGSVCPKLGHLVAFFGLGIFSLVSTIIGTIIGACIYTVRPNGLQLVVMGGSFQMNESLHGNVTLLFTMRANNPTSRSITYNNISGTIAVLNEYGENEDHQFLRFSMGNFDVRNRTFVDSPTQVTATQLIIAKNSIGVVLHLNGTMETSSRNCSASYSCRILTSKDDQDCSRVKSN